MRWLPADKASPVLRTRLTPFLLAGQVLLAGYLSSPGWQITVSFALALAAAAALLRLQSTFQVMFVTGGLGMLAGMVVDMNRLGVYALLEVCGRVPSFSFDAIGARLSATPWTHAGMFLGGSAGAFVPRALNRQPVPVARSVVYGYLSCNLGMILGMHAAESIALLPLLTLGPELAIPSLLASMLFGMGAGMAIAALGVRWLERVESRWSAKRSEPRGSCF